MHRRIDPSAGRSRKGDAIIGLAVGGDRPGYDSFFLPGTWADDIIVLDAMRSEHHLVIVRRDAVGGLSTLRIGDALPCIESEERRSADVAALNHAVRVSLGLETSVLRCISDEPGDERRPRRHLYLMEAHGELGVAPARARWVTGADIPADAGANAEWTQPGWRDGVIAWVNEALARRAIRQQPLVRLLPPTRGPDPVEEIMTPSPGGHAVGMCFLHEAREAVMEDQGPWINQF